jgi:hypothetical protein
LQPEVVRSSADVGDWELGKGMAEDAVTVQKTDASSTPL